MRRLLQIPMLLTVVLVIGAVGLHLLTKQPLLTCFFQAFILLTTVGSEEPRPMTGAVMVFIMAYLACGLGLFAYSAFQFGNLLLNSDFRAIVERRRMENKIAKLSDHFIVCGFGRMGKELCEYLAQRSQPFVVIDEREDAFCAEQRQRGWLFLRGDATQDRTLENAGIANARGLTTVLPTDADNLYVVLSARLLSDGLQIVARASNDRAAQKMRQAGATRVINPLSSGAIRMARVMLSPSIENFIEVTEGGGVDWEIAEVQIPADSPLIAMALKDTQLRESGIMVLGVCRDSGEKLFPPPGDLQFESGDNVFAFGNAEDLSRLSALVSSEDEIPARKV